MQHEKGQLFTGYGNKTLLMRIIPCHQCNKYNIFYVTDVVSVLFKYNESTCFHIEKQHFETRHICMVTNSRGRLDINAKQLNWSQFMEQGLTSI